MSGIKTMDLGGDGTLRETKTMPVITPDVYRAVLYKATLAARVQASKIFGNAITLRLSLSVANHWALNNGFKAGYNPLADELFTSMVGESVPTLERYLKNSGLSDEQVQGFMEKITAPIVGAILDKITSEQKGVGQHD